jgi:hypothetical protein
MIVGWLCEVKCKENWSKENSTHEKKKAINHFPSEQNPQMVRNDKYDGNGDNTWGSLNIGGTPLTLIDGWMNWKLTFLTLFQLKLKSFTTWKC